MQLFLQCGGEIPGTCFQTYRLGPRACVEQMRCNQPPNRKSPLRAGAGSAAFSKILWSPHTNLGRIQCFRPSLTQRGEAFATCSPRISRIASGKRVATLAQSSMPFSGCVPEVGHGGPCPQISRRSAPATSSRRSGAESEYSTRCSRFWNSSKN
jgi:hypothetical protein